MRKVRCTEKGEEARIHPKLGWISTGTKTYIMHYHIDTLTYRHALQYWYTPHSDAMRALVSTHPFDHLDKRKVGTKRGVA